MEQAVVPYAAPKPREKAGKDDVSLDQLKAWFNDAEDSSHEERLQSEQARDYVDGNQLTEEEVRQLKARGQPVVVMNQIRRKINWLRGLEVQRRTDPKGFPRTPEDQQGADAMTDALRFVVDNTDFDRIRSMVWENMLIEGYGGAEVVHEVKRDRAEIAINFYHWDRLFHDQHSREPDFSDARHKGAVVWRDADDVKMRFPKAAASLDEMIAASTSASETYDDIPRENRWISSDRKRIRVVLMWYRQGDTWHWCRFTGAVKLDGGPSPYVDEDGASVCPLVLQSCYVDRNGGRYGVVKDMISPQDEINKRRSKALWQSTARQTLMDKGAVDSVTELKRQMARADGNIEVNPDARFEILPNNDQIAVHLQLQQEAKGEIEGMSANAVLAGQAGESTSGRAVLARQEGGLIEIAPLMDALNQFSRNIYRHIWWLVRQTWTDERWIRVTDDQRNVRFVGLNQPVTLREKLNGMPEEEALGVARQIGLQPGDPRLQMMAGRKNPVDEIDIDIQLEDVPDMVSVQGETFDALVQMAPLIGQNPNLAPVWMQLLLEVAPLRSDTRDKLLEALTQQAQGQGPVQQIMQEAAVRKEMAGAFKAENEAGVGGLPPEIQGAA